MAKDFDVVISGGGPVGLGLAIELGQRGVRCVVVERDFSEHNIPKGQSLTNRTLEHFYSWGCVKELRAARKLPKDFPIGNVTIYRNADSPYFFYQGGGGPGRGEAVAQLYFQRAERLPQYETEKVIRARLAQLPNVTVEGGWQLTGASQSDQGISATIQNLQTGESRSVSGEYLVGADGSRSTVRTLAGITRTYTELGERMVLVVFRSAGLEAVLANYPPTTTVRILKPELEGHWQFFGRVDGRDTFFFHAPVEKDATLDHGALTELMNSAIGRQFEAEIYHAGFWDLRIAIADDYRTGRFFIAGDACHSHPPYGGYGLNSGLEDARNLGWKLAATLQGWGGEALLDSYGLERRPVFQQTGELIAGGVERERDFLKAFSPEKDKADFERAWEAVPMMEERVRYIPHYAGSPIVVGAQVGRSPGIDGLHTTEASAGGHLAPAGLTTGEDVFEVLGQAYSLLVFDAPGAADAFRSAAAAVGLPLSVVEDSYAEPRTKYGHRLILVRPDQFVAWAGEEVPADVEGLLKTVRG